MNELKQTKEILDENKKNHELLDAKNDLTNIQNLIRSIQYSNNYNTKEYDDYIQNIVDKYRNKDIVRDYYNSDHDNNKEMYNYNSLLTLNNMINNYIQRTIASETIKEINKEE